MGIKGIATSVTKGAGRVAVDLIKDAGKGAVKPVVRTLDVQKRPDQSTATTVVRAPDRAFRSAVGRMMGAADHYASVLDAWLGNPKGGAPKRRDGQKNGVIKAEALKDI